MVRLVRMSCPLLFRRQMSCGIMSAADCHCCLAFSSVCTSIASPLMNVASGIPPEFALLSLILVGIAGRACFPGRPLALPGQPDAAAPVVDDGGAEPGRSGIGDQALEIHDIEQRSDRKRDDAVLEHHGPLVDLLDAVQPDALAAVPDIHDGEPRQCRWNISRLDRSLVAHFVILTCCLLNAGCPDRSGG